MSTLETKIEVLCAKIDALITLVKWQSATLLIVVCVIALGSKAGEVLDKLPVLGKAVAESTK